MKTNHLLKIVLLVLIYSINTAQQWQSEIVYYDANNMLTYIRDSEGNAVPDFSYAGYKNGNDSIPFIPVVKTISPVEGDNTNNINNALVQVAYESVKENGFRGALLLEAGTYEVSGKLYMKFPGIVLRGVGDGDDPATNTIIKATGNSPSKRTVLTAGGGSSSKWSNQVSGTKRNITSDTVLVGENSFEVDDASPYQVGDNIIIYHPCSEKWLEAIDFGGIHGDESGAEPGIDVPWEVDSQPLVFNRFITAIEGNKITIDVPVYNHLIKDLSESYIYKYSRTGIVTNLGIENLRIDIKTSGSDTDENHAWNAIDFYQVEDSWIRNCTFLHFGLSGVMTNTTTRVTVENCKALDPVSTITGGNRYNFNTYTASQQILFKDCYARNGRHSYVSNGMSWTSGVVFYNCTVSGAYAPSEGHRRWSMGFLYDHHKELDGPRAGINPRLLGLFNRGHYGTSHGWAMAHGVAWNCDVNNGELIVQKPPTAQNYAIGCFGKRVAGMGESTFNEPAGYIEGSNKEGLYPSSLYIAQLNERLDKLVSVKPNKIDNLLPQDFIVYQNYPNPFNPSTTISYNLPSFSKVKVVIADVLGREIKMLFNGYADKGYNNIVWNGSDNLNTQAASGVYFYLIETDFGIQSRKMILVK